MSFHKQKPSADFTAFLIAALSSLLLFATRDRAGAFVTAANVASGVGILISLILAGRAFLQHERTQFQIDKKVLTEELDVDTETAEDEASKFRAWDRLFSAVSILMLVVLGMILTYWALK